LAPWCRRLTIFVVVLTRIGIPLPGVDDVLGPDFTGILDVPLLGMCAILDFAEESC
jgi:hypothetical protein